MLGEPCVNVSGDFAIPTVVNDLPSEGSYGEVGGVVVLCATSDPTNCGTFMGYGYTIATGFMNRLCFEFTGDNSPAQQTTIRVGSGPAGSGPTSDAGTIVTQKSLFASGNYACPPDSNAVANYSCGTSTDCSSTTAPWEWRYGSTGSANSDWTGNMEYLPPLSFWGAEIGARMTLGNHGPATNDAQIFCATSATGTTTTTLNVAGYDAFQDDYVPTFDPGDTGMENPIWEREGQSSLGIAAASCTWLIAITVTVCSFNEENAEVCELLQWSSTAYTNDTPYTDDPPIVGICVLFPANPNCDNIVEPQIVCEIAYSDPGNPITVIAEFFGGLPGWVTCMTIPVGWDRGNLLMSAVENGNAAAFVEGLDAAIPNSIACGEVFEITTTIGLGTISIDTCDADLAPSWAKGVVAGIIILGLAGLAIQRIFWAVGTSG